MDHSADWASHAAASTNEQRARQRTAPRRERFRWLLQPSARDPTPTLDRRGALARSKPAFRRLPQLHVDTLIVSADLFLLSQHKQVVAAATQYNLPTMYPW